MIYHAWLGSFFEPKNEPKIKPNLARFGSLLAHFKIKLKQALFVILYNLYWNLLIEVNELNLKSYWAYLKLDFELISSLSLSLYQAGGWAYIKLEFELKEAQYLAKTQLDVAKPDIEKILHRNSKMKLSSNSN